MTHITDEAVQAAAKAIMRSGDTYTEMAKAALAAALPYLQPVDVAAVRRQAFEEAARLVETSAYRSTTEGRSLVSCQFAKHDQHHGTIANAIRSLSAEPAQGEKWQPTTKGQQHETR